MKNCRLCNIPLTNENWPNYKRKSSDFRCKSCVLRQQRERYAKIGHLIKHDWYWNKGGQKIQSDNKKAWYWEHGGRERQLEKYWKEGGREKGIEKHRMDRYGISTKDFNEKIQEQDGKCAICDIALLTLPERSIHIDHDHETGKVGGILCNKCNMILGHIEKEKLLDKIKVYLTKCNRL